ncbi:MAG TPA: hypothetical protein VGR69_10995 [Candidatus Rubrimentiphilum sp.]|nr:hypothetical protein [Candidatus Rubrimentiphilum sp.]
MKRLPGGFICAVMLALAVCSPAYAKLFPVTVTVMQHGGAVPGVSITAIIDGSPKSGVTDKQGSWTIGIPSSGRRVCWNAQHGKSRSFHECWAIREQPAHFTLELR